MGGPRDGLGLPADGWAAFAALHPTVRRHKEELIYRQGELAPCFYYLQTGRVKIFLSSPEGMEKTLTVREAGSVFGEAAFFDALPRMSSARAMEEVSLTPIGAHELLEAFAREPALAMHMLQYLAKTVRMLSAQVDTISFLQAENRIAQLLLELARDGSVFCTHEELAMMAGVSRVSVSRALGTFARRGWVRTGYRAIHLADPAALAACAFEGD